MSVVAWTAWDTGEGGGGGAQGPGPGYGLDSTGRAGLRL
jgi:hypothetical protein